MADAWGETFLRRCGIDPGDPADVRAAYQSCHESHVQWVLHRTGEMDGETFRMLVDAILSASGWSAIPLDWPAPYIAVLPPGGLRNMLTRKPTATEG